MGVVRKSYPRFRREGDAPRIELTPDDLAMMLCVYRHRFIRADDLYRLFPHRSRDRLSRRLTWLYRNKYLDRPIAQVDRFRADAPKALVYGLDNAGARVVAEQFGVPIGSADWRSRNRAFTRENLEHTLAVTRFMVDLELSARGRPNVEVIEFDEILAKAPEETRRSALPMRWAVPVSWSMMRAEVQVMPDAIFGLRVRREHGRPIESFYFVEIDRGTMTIIPNSSARASDGFLYRATVLRKMLAYLESWERTIHTQRFGVPSVRVLFLTSTPARLMTMLSASEYIPSPPTGVFLFGSSKDLDDALLGPYTSNAKERNSTLLSQ